MEVALTRPGPFGAWEPNDSAAQGTPQKHRHDHKDDHQYFDYTRRVFWLRAGVLGSSFGLASVTLLMMGMDPWLAAQIKDAIVTCLAGLVADSLWLAALQYVSTGAQVDTMACQLRRDIEAGRRDRGERAPRFPSPVHVAVVVLLSNLVAGMVPLLAAVLIRDGRVRAAVAAATAVACMVAVGVGAAALGRAPVGVSVVRVVLGGWFMIAVVFGKNKFLAAVTLSD